MKRIKYFIPLLPIIAWEVFAFNVTLHYGDTLINYRWWETSLFAFIVLIVSIFIICLKIGSKGFVRVELVSLWAIVFSALTYGIHLEGVALGLFFTPSKETMKKADLKRGGAYPDENYSNIKWGFEDYGTAVRRWENLR